MTLQPARAKLIQPPLFSVPNGFMCEHKPSRNHRNAYMATSSLRVQDTKK
jgi:hypothetical protein